MKKPKLININIEKIDNPFIKYFKLDKPLSTIELHNFNKGKIYFYGIKLSAIIEIPSLHIKTTYIIVDIPLTIEKIFCNSRIFPTKTIEQNFKLLGEYLVSLNVNMENFEDLSNKQINLFESYLKHI